jgi:exosortase
MKSSSSPPYGRLLILCAIMLAAHFPLIAPYFVQLWGRPEYQFFPFAILTFLGLLWTRHDRSAFHFGWLSGLLLVVDLLCLAGAWLLDSVMQNGSPWLAWVGLVAGSAAIAHAFRDEGYSRRLTYLILLLLITVRLPLNYDQTLIHWLQRVTTAVSSRTLLQFNFIHSRDGMILNFPGKSLLVEEACSGVQSLFTVLFLAAGIVCLKRRSLLHSAFLLLSSALFAGLMNCARIIAIAVAWDDYQLDWSHGMQHEMIGYGALFVAAFLLLSADELLAFFTNYIPDVRGSGTTAIFRNPLVAIWNRLMAVVPSQSSSSSARMTANSSSTPEPVIDRATRFSPAAAESDSATRRSWPTLAEFLKPANTFHFLLAVIEGWIFSRKTKHLLAGIPAMLALTAVGTAAWSIRYSSDAPIVRSLEQYFNQSVAAGDLTRQETALRSLMMLRSQESQYRFRLAQFMLQNGRLNEGLNEVLSLTPAAGPGDTEARLWLVRQAMSPSAIYRMTAEDTELQLKAILNVRPDHQEAHQLLARLYTVKKEWKLAEYHLSQIVKDQPELYLEIAKLRKLQQRSREDIELVAQQAIDALVPRLDAGRDNTAARIALAEAYTIRGLPADARSLLVSGLEQAPNPLLQKALSDFDLRQIEQRISQSALNQDVCLPAALDVLRRDPVNRRAIVVLTQLQRLGARIPADAMTAALETWQQRIAQPDATAEDRAACSQLLMLTGDYDKAAEVLEPATLNRPELKLILGQLQLQAGKNELARATLEPLLDEFRRKLEEKPGDEGIQALVAESLILLKRFDDVHSLLGPLVQLPTRRIPENALLGAIYARASLGKLDELIGLQELPQDPEKSLRQPVSIPQDADAEKILSLLMDVYSSAATNGIAIDRLARISLANHPVAAGADAIVRQLRLEGPHGGQVLNLLGMHALIAGRYDKARGYLEQAILHTRGEDPMVLNNLATAMIRSDQQTADEALKLVNNALEKLPDHPDILSSRGEIRLAMEQWPQAVTDLRHALTIQQDNAELHRLLEQAYRGLPDPAMADEHKRRAEALEQPDSSSPQSEDVR